MSFVEMHPDYVATLRRQGLAAAADFLRLQGPIVGGHPDRHVIQVALAAETAYLKKEHRTSWRDRLAHWCRGDGWVSKSTREGRLLRELENAGIGCPRVIAYGEGGGRAFLLLREEPGAVELRVYLRDHEAERFQLAAAFGRELARLHAAGFQHRDLSSKHVLVRRTTTGWRFCLLDWQRGSRRRRTRWRQRLLDLATLDATLAETLAPRRVRLLFWRHYLAGLNDAPAHPGRLLRALCRLSAALQRKRRIRELRQPPLASEGQKLIWLDGERLVITPAGRKTLEDLPAELLQPANVRPGSSETISISNKDGPELRLTRRVVRRPWPGLMGWFGRPAFPTPEFEQAATILRLERYGIAVPRLLALGHRRLCWRQTFSFLLTQPIADVVDWREYVAGASPRQRHEVLRRTGAAVRRIHEAGYDGADLPAVWGVERTSGTLVLVRPELLRRHRRSPKSVGQRMLRALGRRRWPGFNAVDRWSFVLGYLGGSGTTRAVRTGLLALVAKQRRTVVHAKGIAS
ncbi:MAG: lipopolysaccharide kinase InaA family protein [Gemmataceae bacterium]|nr:lipopolysaccharide kinase InaA family protein [Gemmataceae bacterium]